MKISIDSYIKLEQPNTNFDLREKINVDHGSDIEISFDANRLSNNSYSYIQKWSEIFDGNDLEVGSFELDIFNIKVNRVKHYEKKFNKSMRYFILLPDDSEEDVDYSTNILGEVSFKNFWTEEGFGILERLVEKYPDTLTEVKIKDEQNKNYAVEQFLEKIKNLRIIKMGKIDLRSIDFEEE